MIRNLTMLLACILTLLLVAPVSLAQTPDGITPPNEGICDPLKADGLTKGLYGLCVAFCEAQDQADILVPITEEEYDQLFDSGPSGKILASYNKKKTEADPPMPCIKIEEPCPCWSAEDLNEIDGKMWDGTPSYSPLALEPDGRRCYDTGTGLGNIGAYEILRNNASSFEGYTQAAVSDFNGRLRCVFQRVRNAANGETEIFQLRSPEFTPEDFEACAASLRAFQASSGFCVTIEN